MSCCGFMGKSASGGGGGSGDFLADGSVPMTGALDMGTSHILLGEGSSPTIAADHAGVWAEDNATVTQLMARAGAGALETLLCDENGDMGIGENGPVFRLNGPQGNSYMWRNGGVIGFVNNGQTAVSILGNSGSYKLQTRDIVPDSNADHLLGSTASNTWGGLVLAEKAAPTNPGANRVHIYVDSTSNNLMAIFDSGAAVTIATHP